MSDSTKSNGQGEPGPAASVTPPVLLAPFDGVYVESVPASEAQTAYRLTSELSHLEEGRFPGLVGTEHTHNSRTDDVTFEESRVLTLVKRPLQMRFKPTSCFRTWTHLLTGQGVGLCRTSFVLDWSAFHVMYVPPPLDGGTVLQLRTFFNRRQL